MRDLDVVVVGGGPAGLAAAACLGRRGLRSVVLERDPEIGRRWASRYDSLHLHTVRRFSGLPYHPLPRSLPRYVARADFAAYLREYAERLQLDVRTGHDVLRIRPRDGWEVETRKRTWRTPAVVVATGRYDRPILPDWPGRDGYRGRLLHAEDYRSGTAFAGLEVLVVGLGSSGAEIAADLVAGGAARVAVAVRSVPPISSREILGVPLQVLGLTLSHLPPRLVDRAGDRLRRLGTGDLSPYGLERNAWSPFTARRPPVIDVGFLRVLRSGRIEMRPAVVDLTEESTRFADGTEERFDAVVAATGYRTVLDELLGGASAEAPGLHLVGFRESVRGGLYEIGRDAHRVSRALVRELAA